LHSNDSGSHVHVTNGIRRDGGCPETPFSDQRCLWCNTMVVQARRHGSLKRFCCAGHRNAFWTAARRWVMRAVEAGLLPAQALKAHQGSVHAFAEAVPTGGIMNDPT
jgi:hypothetical protein